MKDEERLERERWEGGRNDKRGTQVREKREDGEKGSQGK